MSEAYISLEEMAKKLDVSVAMIYKLVSSREIKSIRVGRLYRVPVSEFEAFLERGGSPRKEAQKND